MTLTSIGAEQPHSAAVIGRPSSTATTRSGSAGYGSAAQSGTAEVHSTAKDTSNQRFMA